MSTTRKRSAIRYPLIEQQVRQQLKRLAAVLGGRSQGPMSLQLLRFV